MKTLEQLHQELDNPIPRSAVKTREGAGRKSFSYLSTDYVIDRMNKLFGNLNWATDTLENKVVYEGQINGKYTCHYVARVKVEAQHIDENGRVIRTQHVGTGYGDGSDGSNPGKAHELAAKEAESDALKRACKNFGQSNGLALYDKDQTNVVEDEKPAGNAHPAAQEAFKKVKPAPAAAPSPVASKPAGESTRQKLNDNITAVARVLNETGKQPFAATKAQMIKDYNADTKEKLSDEQAQDFYAKLSKLASGSSAQAS